MGDNQGYLKEKRSYAKYRPVAERLGDYREVELLREAEDASRQAGRCMDCGTPFCHSNCPISNYIPEWNDFAYRGKWREAWESLSLTSSFAEITGRLCPALCEGGCVLAYNDEAVSIRQNELDIVERAFSEGWIKPRIPKRTAYRVAIVGSGPAGLAAADALNQKGHGVTVFERDAKPGGFLRYGIPDFKLDKSILDRRIRLLEAEGIVFSCGRAVGDGRDESIDASSLRGEYDAVLLAGGSRALRDLKVPGRELSGVHFAVDYLSRSNKAVSGEEGAGGAIDARGKRVVVIGGGDTGSDCVGTANRQGARSVTQIEILPKPPEKRPASQPWPLFPRLYHPTSSHEEGVIQDFLVNTRAFRGTDGSLRALECVKVEWDMSGPRPAMKEIPGTEFTIEADMAVLALGFTGAERSPLTEALGVEFAPQGTVKADAEYRTSVPGVYSAGDMRRGQSLIVWAIMEGKAAADAIARRLGEPI
jgi:glutamate synthase (NADPH) small chain